jgi:hypothetical protein
MKDNELTLEEIKAIAKHVVNELVRQGFLARRTFPTWKTIKLGTHKKVNDLKKAITEISDWANDMMDKESFTLASAETEVDLVVLSVAELGFTSSTKYSDICARALQLGLQLCPAEVGPQLRLQYANQPKGELLRIAMEPITVSVGGPLIFIVSHDRDCLFLRSLKGDPNDTWNTSSRFVFVRPRE